MCGLLGFIGESKNPDLTFNLLTRLLIFSEIRGEDATGYWGAQKNDGKIAYYKEGISATEFVQKEEWKLLKNFNANFLLSHVRKTSAGIGNSSFNQNNHPFASSDRSLSIIHNGRIDDVDYRRLKNLYELNSDCDSELILRIIENFPQNDFRLNGIKEIFSNINNGHMAVAVGERCQDKRTLWLFRNKFRPLWIIDLREFLGQIFFISDPNIWDELISKNKEFKIFEKKEKIYEIPSEEVWIFEISSQIPTPRNVTKYKLIKNNTISANQNFEKYKIIHKNPCCEIVTSLDNFDKLSKNNNLINFYNVCDESIDLIHNIKMLCDGYETIDYIENLTMIMEEENNYFKSLCDQLRVHEPRI